MLKKKTKIALLVIVSPILLGILVTLFSSQILDSGCSNSVIEEIPSPNNKYKIIIFSRNCGAATGFSTQVTLLPEKKELQNKPGNIFLSDTDHGKAPSGPSGGPIVNAVWESNDTVNLKYHNKARVFHAAIELDKIKIIHNKIE